MSLSRIFFFVLALSVFMAVYYYIGIHLERSYKTGNNSSTISKTNDDIVVLQTNISSSNFKNYINDESDNDGAPYQNISSSYQQQNYIVLLTCSDGFYEMWLNWLHFFQLLDISNILPIHLFAEDYQTNMKCLQLVDEINVQSTKYKPNITCLPWDFVFSSSNVSHSLNAMTYGEQGYKKLMSHRPAIIQKELELGYHIIFSDIDVVWKKNPLPYINDAREDDESVHILSQGEKPGGKQSLCPGFTIFLSCPETIALINQWRLELDGKVAPNQGPFNQVVNDAMNNGIDVSYKTSDGRSITEKRAFKAKSLSQKLFPQGNWYGGMSGNDREKAVIVHGNWIKGYKEKINRFRKWGLWVMDDKKMDTSSVGVKVTQPSQPAIHAKEEIGKEVDTSNSISLIVSFWAKVTSAISLRYHEIETALIANLANQHLSQLVVILDSITEEDNCNTFEHKISSLYAEYHNQTNASIGKKLICIPHEHGQPAYFDMFRYVTHKLVTSRVVIVANADHVFDQTLHLAGLLRTNTVLTLSNHGYYTKPSGSAILVPPHIQQYYKQAQLFPGETLNGVVDMCNKDVPSRWKGQRASWDAYVFERQLLQGKTFNDTYFYREPHKHFYMNTGGAENAALNDLLKLMRDDLPKNESIVAWNGCQYIHAFHYHFAPKYHRTSEHGRVPGPQYIADILSPTNFSSVFTIDHFGSNRQVATSDTVPDNSGNEEGVGEDKSTQSRAKCYPLSNSTRLTNTSSMVISTPNTTTNKPFLSGTFVLQTMGEMGNNLAALAYYYAVKTLAYEEFNLILTLHVRKQNVHKADSAAENVKCLKSFKDVDFDECNWFKNGKGKICQDKVSNQFKGFKHLARCTDNHTLLELSENLRMTSGTSDGIRSILKVYVDILNDTSIMELFREMKIGWSTDEPWPFLCNEGRVHASDQLINEFYSKGLPQYFAFDNETKISSGCCSRQIPEKDEVVFHYRSFIKDLPINHHHMHWGGAELRPDNAAKMLLESLPNGSKVALVSGRSDMDRVLAYKHAFQNSTFSVRVIRGKKSIHDFCFLAFAQAGLWGTIQSTFIRWASLISTDLQNATLYGVNYPMRDKKITSSKVSSNPDLARIVHYPVFDVSDDDVW